MHLHRVILVPHAIDGRDGGAPVPPREMGSGLDLDHDAPVDVAALVRAHERSLVGAMHDQRRAG